MVTTIFPHSIPDGSSSLGDYKPTTSYLKYLCLGLPWWCSGWESAYQCRGHGFEPWFGKTPHAAEQLSLCVTTTEPVCHNY